VDHTLLLQEYVTPAAPFITRVEIVDGEFLHALIADTSQGFELCPADACRIDELACPADGTADSLFAWRRGVTAADAAPWVDVAARLGIEIAGFEFIETADGRWVTYDVNTNTNTNYNPDGEREAPRSGPAGIAAFLGRLLAAEEPAASDGSPQAQGRTSTGWTCSCHGGQQHGEPLVGIGHHVVDRQSGRRQLCPQARQPELA
jgi:hypothetical protein